MFGGQQNLISPNKELKAILEFLCSESSKLTNCARKNPPAEYKCDAYESYPRLGCVPLS